MHFVVSSESPMVVLDVVVDPYPNGQSVEVQREMSLQMVVGLTVLAMVQCVEG